MIAEDAILIGVIVAEPATVGYSSGTGTGVCANGTVLSKNSEGTTLATTTVASGGSADAAIADTSINVVDSGDTVVSSLNVVAGKAGQKANAPDGTVYIVDQDGLDLAFLSVKSGEFKDVVLNIPVCSPATAVVQYLDGTLIESREIASGTSDTISVPNPVEASPATAVVQYVDGTLIESREIASGTSDTISVPNPLTLINTSSLYKTGKTTSYVSGDDGDLQIGRGTDFDTLDYLNGFGTYDRFTDDFGLQNYTNRICLDWSQWDRINNTVIGYYMDTVNGNMSLPTPTGISACNALTVGAFSGWKVANINEILVLSNYETLSDAYLGLPLQRSISSGASQIYTSTYVSSTNVMMINTSCLAVSFSGSVTRSVVPVRIFTLTELGL